MTDRTAPPAPPAKRYAPPGEGLLTEALLLEIRRNVIEEIRQLRAYADEAPEHQGELKRVLNATADRLEAIIGGAPV